MAFTAVVVALCGGAIGAQNQTHSTLDKLAQAFVEAFNKKDAAGVAQYYTEDATLMPPNHPIVKGRAAIQAYFESEFKQGLTDLRLTPAHSEIAGSFAFEAGTLDLQIGTQPDTMLTLGVGSGTSVRDRGKYLVVYKRVGSDWKIHYDIFNSDSPPRPPK